MIENALLTTSIEPIFTAPGTPGDLNVQSAITTMIFCNVLAPDTTPPIDDTTNETYINVYVVKSGQSASNTVNAIIKNLRVPAGETVFFDTERLVLGSGDSIQAQALDSNAVVATISILPV
jgi:hypothetical protein